jgi:hypothetical protein
VTEVRTELSDFVRACNKLAPADVSNVLVADAQYVLGTL